MRLLVYEGREPSSVVVPGSVLNETSPGNLSTAPDILFVKEGFKHWMKLDAEKTETAIRPVCSRFTSDSPFPELHKC